MHLEAYKLQNLKVVMYNKTKLWGQETKKF